MPVNFYPDKPIDLLEKYITKDNGNPLMGEIEIYRKIFHELGDSSKDWHIWHDLKLPFHSDRSNPHGKTSAQIDFLILCDEGVLVLEVKGGPISMKNNTFYYGNNYETTIDQNPFSQAEGYKFTVKDNILNTGSRYIVCHAVAFPHCGIDFESRVIENNILWTNITAISYNNSFEKFISSVFKYNRSKHQKYHRNFPKLKQKDVFEIKRILSPLVHDLNRYYNTDTSEWLNVSNLEILESMSKNDRIMIEGGPGTGKTTLAKAFIDQQITKKGLYLSWNNLLMHKMKHELKQRGTLKTCEVDTFSRLLLKLDDNLAYKDLFKLNENEFYELVKKVVEELKIQEKLPHYDYLVLDEGQDILDKGIDIIINEFLGDNSDGLKNGKVLLLYDIDQSYFSDGRDITEIAELLSIYFAHFKLNEVKRSAQCPDIKKLASKAIKDPESLSSQLFEPSISNRVDIHFFVSLEEIKNYIVKNILSSIRDKNSSLKGNQCILLIESTLLRPHYKNEPGMHFYLELKDIEELTEDNIGDTSNKLRYTSILRFKGLESENVILVVREPGHLNKYELYIGVTRAISNLELLVIKN